MPRRALLIVKEVSGVASFAERLVTDFGYELLAGERAGEALCARGISFVPVETSTAAGLVSDKSQGIDLVVANFVDVESAGRAFMSWKSALAAFDRGIVEALRAAAWAADRVAALGNPSDYGAALAELEKRGGSFSQSFRTERATAALRATSEFDFAVAGYLEIQGADAPDLGALSGYPRAMRFAWPRAQALDAGENRHQKAALYGSFFSHFEQIAGSPLDYASILGVSKAAYLIGEFEKAAAALLRNGRLVVLAEGRDTSELAAELLKTHAAPGMWLALNGSVGETVIDAAAQNSLAGVLAPDFSEAERSRLAKSEPMRALRAIGGLGYEALQEARSVIGGALVQDKDRFAINPMEWTVHSFAQPKVEDWEPLVFGAKALRHVDSCGCVVLRDGSLLALEQGRASQLEALRLISAKGIDFSDTLVALDEPIESSEVLRFIRESGARLALCPYGLNTEAMAALANELGMALMSMPRSLRRL